MLHIKTFVCNSYEENAIIINKKGLKEAIIIDPGCTAGEETEKILAYLNHNDLTPVAILLTHAHADHTHGVAELQRVYNIPVFVSKDEDLSGLAIIPTYIHDGEVLELASIKFEVITTPGHTPGSVCYLDRDDKVIFSGDTLFAGTIGRTDLKGGDYDKLIVSIMNKIMGLDGDIKVFPGHARSTSIAEERTQNPFLQPFNEPEEEDF